MAVLKVIKGSCPGQLVELLGERNVMGRHPSCQIVLDNAAVSRNHAQILESHGTYYLEDLRSRNGTLLNGNGVKESQPIKAGDKVAAGHLTIEVRERPSEVQRPVISFVAKNEGDRTTAEATFSTSLDKVLGKAVEPRPTRE